MIDIRCPKCQARYRVPDTLVGKKAKCKGCQAVLTVEAAVEEVAEVVPAEEEEVVEVVPVSKDVVVRAKRVEPVDEEEDEENDKPRSKRGKRSEQEDDEEAEDDEEDDEDIVRPKKRRPEKKKRTKKKKGGLLDLDNNPTYTKWNNVIGGLVGGAAAVALAIYLYSQLSDVETGKVASIRVPAWIAFLYDIGGKWGVTAVLGLIGVSSIIYGFVALASPPETKE